MSIKLSTAIGFAAAAGIAIAGYASLQEQEPVTLVKTQAQCEQEAKTAGQALYQNLKEQNPGTSKLTLASLALQHPETKEIADKLQTCSANTAQPQPTPKIHFLGFSF